MANIEKGKETKAARVIYWVTTLLFCFFMLSGGIMMLLGVEGNVKGIEDLGYPAYFCRILGAAKVLGVIAILWGRLPLMKEWAYAGFTFLMIGATATHFFQRDEVWRSLVTLGILLLVLISHRQWKKA